MKNDGHKYYKQRVAPLCVLGYDDPASTYEQNFYDKQSKNVNCFELKELA